MPILSQDSKKIRTLIESMNDEDLRSSGPKDLEDAIEKMGLVYAVVRERVNNELARARKLRGIRKGRGRRIAAQFPTDSATRLMTVNYCTLNIANNNARLLVCSCGFMGSVLPDARVCPQCRMVPTSVMLVDCADPNHNEPEGCGNPSCWKHQKKPKDQPKGQTIANMFSFQYLLFDDDNGNTWCVTNILGGLYVANHLTKEEIVGEEKTRILTGLKGKIGRSERQIRQ